MLAVYVHDRQQTSDWRTSRVRRPCLKSGENTWVDTHVTAPTRFVRATGLVAYVALAEIGIPLSLLPHISRRDGPLGSGCHGWIRQDDQWCCSNKLAWRERLETLRTRSKHGGPRRRVCGALGLSRSMSSDLDWRLCIAKPSAASPCARPSHDSRGDRSSRRRPVSGFASSEYAASATRSLVKEPRRLSISVLSPTATSQAAGRAVGGRHERRGR